MSKCFLFFFFHQSLPHFLWPFLSPLRLWILSNFCNSDARTPMAYIKIQKKKKILSVTSVSIPFIVIFFYLLLTGGSSFNKTHRIIGGTKNKNKKKWVLTFSQAYNSLVLCKIQPFKNAKNCLNIRVFTYGEIVK